VQDVIDHFGGKSRLAEALGVDRAAVSHWLRHGLPPWRAIQIERMTAGRFLARDIVGTTHGTD
jgi:DNA-binding transcriptional regulator YdaS (Cro superfamily)